MNVIAENDSISNNGIVTIENLQDLLIYDDTFLDYFNVFLKLPVFPQPLEYHRLTDSFKIINEEFDSVVSCNSPPAFVASEEEQIKILEWAQKYRLPLFLKTDLYRELKLSKLLIKPLETIPSSSRETFVRGYSKQTNCSSFTTPSPSIYSDVTSKSNSMVKSLVSANSSANKKKKFQETSDEDFYEIDENNFPFDNYLRPGSRAISLPIKIQMGNYTNEEERNRKKKRLDNEYSKVSKNNSNLSEELNNVKNSRQKTFKTDYWDEDNIYFRIQSAPLNYNAINFGSVNDDIEGSMNDELDAIQGRQKMSLQRLKEEMIGTHEGMNEFVKFLLNTAGKCLCDFWLDCEQLKDLSAFRTEEENIDLRNSLMRNLKDKYKLNLTKMAKNQLNEAMKNTTKIHSIFLQAQYDTLRRLRSYWLPRYLIHQESILRQFTLTDFFYLRLPTFQTNTFSIQSGVLPKLCLQSTLPYTTQQTDIQARTWNQIMQSSNYSISEVSKLNIVNREKSNFSDVIFKRSAFQNRLRFSLGFDTSAGGPFKNYLQSHNLVMQMKNLAFYQEVIQFKSMYSRNSDQLLRLSRAWSIVNQFISSNGSQFIGSTEEECKDITMKIQKHKSSIKCEVFDNLIEYSIRMLQNEWLIYLKEDVKKFMESSITHFDNESPPHTIDEVEVTIEGETIVVRRKVVLKEIQLKSKTWDQLSKKEKKKRHDAALELKRITEQERRKVLKAVKQRIKEQLEEERRLKTMSYLKFQPTMKSLNNTTILENEENELELENEETLLSMEQIEIKEEENIPDIKRVMKNKILLELFKKYVIDGGDSIRSDIKNAVMLLYDISSYLSIEGVDKAIIVKKDNKASNIYRSYLDKAATKKVKLNDKIESKLAYDQERPKSPLFKEIQNHVCNSLTDIFKEFWKFQTMELKVSSDILAKMTETELQLMAGNQLRDMVDVKKGASTAVHTMEDKSELILCLQEASYQPLTLEILRFFNYLVEKGSQDKLNNLENDLIFYVEVLKLKEICNTTIDEDIAKKKIQCISSIFLESVHPPAVQINIPNDVAQRILRQVQRQLTSKEISVNVFEEIQYMCLKNLLPYWAGFKNQSNQMNNSRFSPFNKYKLLIERRLKIYNDIPIPKAEVVSLPMVPKSNNLTTLSYTMNDGAKWKLTQEAGQDSIPNRPDGTGSDSNKSLIQQYGKKLNRKLSKLSVT